MAADGSGKATAAGDGQGLGQTAGRGVAGELIGRVPDAFGRVGGTEGTSAQPPGLSRRREVLDKPPAGVDEGAGALGGQLGQDLGRLPGREIVTAPPSPGQVAQLFEGVRAHRRCSRR